MAGGLIFRCYSSLRRGGTAVPRRAFLYVPGTDEKKIRKAASLDVDTVCLDCEDAVALSQKDDARSTIIRLLGELDFGRSERAVRVNPISSGIAEDDLKALLCAPRMPDTLVIPKVESADEITWLAKLIGGNERILKPVSIVTMCESALGLLNLRSVLEAAQKEPVLNVQACIFGGDDFAASICATRTPASQELMHARQSVVVHCRAFGVQPIDIVQIDFKDTERLVREAQEGARMGFAGKQVIHPAQVEPVQTAFTPSPDTIAAARELISAFDAHQAKGIGAFSFKGQMIDMPTILQARNVLAFGDGQ